MGAGAAGPTDAVDRVHLVQLLLQLLHARDVAEASERVRSSAGDHVALAPLLLEVPGDVLHRRAHVTSAWHDHDVLDAHEPEQEVVAAGVRVVAARDPLLDHEAALEALLDRRGERDAAVVGLRGAAGHQGVGALGQRVGDEELELAGLVAAGREPELVISLDPHLPGRRAPG